MKRANSARSTNKRIYHSNANDKFKCCAVRQAIRGNCYLQTMKYDPEK